MADPKEFGHRTARDVLADRIATWAGEASVYDYADRLIKDLDAAGFELREKRAENFEQERGAFLMLSVLMPEEDENNDPDAAADSLVAMANKGRREGSERMGVGLWPTPQWFTAGTYAVLKRAHELTMAEGESHG